MKRYAPHITQALILTPAIFLLSFWIMFLSSSDLLVTVGWFKLTLWSLLLSFGAAYSIAMFVREALTSK